MRAQDSRGASLPSLTSTATCYQPSRVHPSLATLSTISLFESNLWASRFPELVNLTLRGLQFHKVSSTLLVHCIWFTTSSSFIMQAVRFRAFCTTTTTSTSDGVERCSGSNDHQVYSPQRDSLSNRLRRRRPNSQEFARDGRLDYEHRLSAVSFSTLLLCHMILDPDRNRRPCIKTRLCNTSLIEPSISVYVSRRLHSLSLRP